MENNLEKAKNPTHYFHESGIETIELTHKLDFIRGNIIKYFSRMGKKDEESKERVKIDKYLELLVKYRDSRPIRDMFFPPAVVYLDWVKKNKTTEEYELQLAVVTKDVDSIEKAFHSYKKSLSSSKS